jgi:tRNA (Thr-GGU) A37 N-methylase
MWIELTAIGFVRGGQTEPVNAGEGYWDQVRSVIDLDPDCCEVDFLKGLDAFSHAEVIFHFHRVIEDQTVTGTQRPQGNPDWPKVGIFSLRSRFRSNRLGVPYAGSSRSRA